MSKDDKDLIAEDRAYWDRELGEGLLHPPKTRCKVCDKVIYGDYGIRIEGVAVCEDCLQSYVIRHYGYTPAKGEKCERCGTSLGGVKFFTKAYKIGGEKLCDDCFWDEVVTFTIIND